MKECSLNFSRTLVGWAILVGLVNVSQGGTRRVPEDFPTLRAAYAAAQDGDTIEIGSNLYLESAGPFNPVKRVSIVPQGGPAIVSANIPPANDGFAGRIALTGASLQASAFNYAAGMEPGEPLRLSPALISSPAHRSLWWSWTAPTEGVVVISSHGSESTPYVEAFTGSTISGLTRVTQLDSQRVNEIQFVTQVGVTYQIRLSASTPAAYGQVVLNIVMPQPPENDDFANRFLLEGLAPKAGSYTYIARREAALSEPNHAGRAAGRSIWFSWTAPDRDPSPRRSVTFSTFGSDFDTVLAVYVGATLNTLVTVASNDDIDLGTTASRVTFVPTPGTLYHIAVDGSVKDGLNSGRDRYGNVVFAVDYSLMNLSADAVNRLATNAAGAISFSADLRLRNAGTETAGPLRVRLMAASTYVPAAVHLAEEKFQTNIGIIPVSAPDSLSPGADRLVPVSGVCPAPIADAQSTSGYRGHGVYALLEERIGSRWVPLDGEFLLYGLFSPPQTDSLVIPVTLGAPLRASVNLPKVNGGQITVEFLIPRGPSSIVEGTTNAVAILARLSDDSEVLVGPDELAWTSPASLTFSPDLVLTNSLLVAGRVGERLTTTNTCRFSYGGTVYLARYILTVYQRPFLEAAFPPPYTQFMLRLLGEAGKRYVLESAPALDSNWHPVSTNIVSAAGPWEFSEPSPSTTLQRFYRARELP